MLFLRITAIVLFVATAGCSDGRPSRQEADAARDVPANAATEGGGRDATADAPSSEAGATDAEAGAPAADARVEDLFDGHLTGPIAPHLQIDCELPSGCITPDARGGVTLPVCCTPAVACGFNLTDFVPAYEEAVVQGIAHLAFPDDFDPEVPCVDKSALYVPTPVETEERVEAEDADILLTPACRGYAFFGAMHFPGCCMPDGQCGLSTHRTVIELAGIFTDPTVAFLNAQCLPAAEVNQAFVGTELEGMEFIPDQGGACDYAAIEGRLTTD